MSLGVKKERAVLALLQEPTAARAARKADVSERTLRRWQSDMSFQDALNAARRELFSEVLARMQGAAAKALEALHGVLEDDDARPSERVAAVRTLLDHAHRAAHAVDVEERLGAVERALDRRSGP